MNAPQFQLCSDDFGNFARLAGTSDNVLVSPKLDGFRCGVVETLLTSYWSRGGVRYGFDGVFDEHITVLCRVLREIGVESDTPSFDCELTHPEGIEVLRDIVQGEREARYSELELNIFDINLPDSILASRFKALARAFERMEPGPVRLVEHANLGAVLSGELVEPVFDAIRDNFVAQGFEGAVFKVADSPYLPGLSPYWLRRVPFQSVDLRVLHVDKGGRALVCDHEGVPVRVTAGLTAANKREFFESPPSVVEVFHRGVTRMGSLRNPVFRRPRPDKVLHGG